MEKILKLQALIIPNNKKVLLAIHLITLCGILTFNYSYLGGFLSVLYIYYTIVFKTPGKDKLEHYYMGLIYFLVGFGIDYFFGYNFFYYVLPLFFGLTKEIRDMAGYGNVELEDFVFTVLFAFMFTKNYHIFLTV